MSTAVYHIELSNGVPDIQLNGHTAALILVTYNGKPLGDLRLKTNRSILEADYLAEQIASHFPSQLLQTWTSDKSGGSKESGTYVTAPPSIDVIVCTSGSRLEGLRKCLESVSRCTYSRKSIILVDNSISGSTEIREMAQSFGAEYVQERIMGLDYARNAGIRASKAEFVAFTDDDAAVHPLWLENIVRAFQSDPAIACVTGLTMPMELDTPAQELFEQYSDGGMRRGYQRRVFHRFNFTPTASGKVGVGANMAFRASVLEKVGLFDEALDCGTPARAGGDSDMFYRILRHGYKICYEPEAIAWHCHRQSMHELRKQLAGYSVAVYAILTKWLYEYRDLNALKSGISWFRHHHLRNLALSLTGKGPMPRSIVMAEIAGVFKGPLAYLRSKSYAARNRIQQGTERRGVISRGSFRRKSGA